MAGREMGGGRALGLAKQIVDSNLYMTHASHRPCRTPMAVSGRYARGTTQRSCWYRGLTPATRATWRGRPSSASSSDSTAPVGRCASRVLEALTGVAAERGDTSRSSRRSEACRPDCGTRTWLQHRQRPSRWASASLLFGLASRAGPGAERPSRSVRPARRFTAPAAAPARGAGVRPARDDRGDRELVTPPAAHGIAVAVDHLEPTQVQALVERIDAEQGQLDILVNDIWGGELCSSGTSRCGSTTSRRACACCASPSTRT